MTIKDLPAALRPREKLLAHGAAALRDEELLALLLRTGMKGTGVLQLAGQLLATFGGVPGLLNADADALRRVKGLPAWTPETACGRFPACGAFRRTQPSPKSTSMPKRTDLKSILIIGAGPIVIGQACEFDYSGTQACKALKEEGYRVILVNSNPAYSRMGNCHSSHSTRCR